MNKPLRGLIVSDFTIDTLKACLVNTSREPAYEINIGPYGQVIPLLMNAADPLWTPRPDVTIVWAQAASAIPSFQQLLEYKPVANQQLLDEGDVFINAIIHAAARTRFLFLASWTLPPFLRGYGPGDFKSGTGWQAAILTLNKRMIDRLSDSPNIFILNTARWTQLAGENAFSPKLWYLSKIPFDPAVFKLAAQDITSAILACLGQSRKIILVDLDDTLWGGTVGETGWAALNMGGHNPAGEAFADFQRHLKNLTNRGIILGIISKNDESVALAAIDQHPEMVLRRRDFAGWRINWHDKAENIMALLAELNLGPDAAVFIDNNPVERGRIRQALPDVLVPEWPQNCLLFANTLNSLTCFDTIVVSDDDRTRAQMYAAETQRREVRARAGDIKEWLKNLGTTVNVEPLSAGNLPRAAQLLNKTNQMNLSTRRLNEQEFLAWSENPAHTVWLFRVKDTLGDSGLTGIISLELSGREGRIIDLVLSCRVFGRNLENLMTAILVDQAAARGSALVTARYLPTEKNKPCLEFLQNRSGFSAGADGLFTWNTTTPYPRPAFLTVAHAP